MYSAIIMSTATTTLSSFLSALSRFFLSAPSPVEEKRKRTQQDLDTFTSLEILDEALAGLTDDQLMALTANEMVARTKKAERNIKARTGNGWIYVDAHGSAVALTTTITIAAH